MYIGLTSYIKVTKVKPGINRVEVHPQMSQSRHPVDGVLHPTEVDKLLELAFFSGILCL
jgi:hypothetical protein